MSYVYYRLQQQIRMLSQTHNIWAFEEQKERNQNYWLLFVSCQKHVVVSIRMLCWAKLDSNLPISITKLCTGIYWAALCMYFALFPFSFSARAKSEGPEKIHRAKLEAKLPAITPKEVLPSHFQSVKLLNCHLFIFVSTCSPQWSHPAPLNRQRAVLVSTKHSPLKTHTGNMINWAEMSAWGWLTHTYLGRVPVVCSILSFTDNGRKANAL